METTNRDFIERDRLVETITNAGEFKPADREALRRYLCEPVIQRALCEFLLLSDIKVTMLGGLDLENPQQLALAKTTQAEARAFASAVEMLADLATTQPNPTEN